MLHLSTTLCDNYHYSSSALLVTLFTITYTHMRICVITNESTERAMNEYIKAILESI